MPRTKSVISCILRQRKATARPTNNKVIGGPHSIHSPWRTRRPESKELVMFTCILDFHLVAPCSRANMFELSQQRRISVSEWGWMFGQHCGQKSRNLLFFMIISKLQLCHTLIMIRQYQSQQRGSGIMLLFVILFFCGVFWRWDASASPLKRHPQRLKPAPNHGLRRFEAGRADRSICQ